MWCSGPVGYQQSSLQSGCASVLGGEQHNSSCDASKMRENKMVDYDIADVPTISPGSSSKSDQINEVRTIIFVIMNSYYNFGSYSSWRILNKLPMITN